MEKIRGEHLQQRLRQRQRQQLLWLQVLRALLQRLLQEERGLV